MLKISLVQLASITLSLLGLNLTQQRLLAQTTYSFNATYDGSSALLSAITEDVTLRTISGESSDAPFGLTQATGLSYVQTDLITSTYRFSTNPATFGLQGLPLGGVTLFGTSDNKLFYGFEDGTGIVDLATLSTIASNTSNIIGGEGLFQGATGTLFGSEIYQIGNLLVDPSSSSSGVVRVSGTISVPQSESVSEPNNTIALLGITAIGLTFLVQRQRLKIASNQWLH